MLGAFSSLTAALLSDLRLDRHVQELSTREVNVCRAHGFPIKSASPGVNRSHEGRRAALGCYIVTTSYAMRYIPLLLLNEYPNWVWI